MVFKADWVLLGRDEVGNEAWEGGKERSEQSEVKRDGDRRKVRRVNEGWREGGRK